MPGLIRTQSIVDISTPAGFVTPLPPFFNSQEPRDSNTLFNDDFSRGAWYNRDADHTGGGCPDVAQWQGSIFGPGGNGSGSPNPPCYGPPNNAAKLTGTGNFGPSLYSAEHQYRNLKGGSTMADHMLVNGADSETEIYVRWYQRFSIGYLFAEEKILTINETNGGGIKFGNLHFNVGAGAQLTTGEFMWQPQIFGGNVTSNYFAHGDMHWNCFQLHMKLNTPGNPTPGSDGILQMYADDCGTGGLAHPGTPTLRASRTNWQYPRFSAAEKIGNVWKENWGNADNVVGSDGSSEVKYFYVSRVGPIPFVESWP